MTAPRNAGGWTATGEALHVAASDQRWNMAVVGPEGRTPEGLVALAFGYSPEGVTRRANLIAAAPELVEALRESQHALEAARAYIIKLSGAKNPHREECLARNAALLTRIGDQS